MEEGRQTPRERSATPSRRHKSKSREGTPRRHRSRSRQETPTQEEQKQGGNLQPESVSRRSSKTPEVMEVDQIGKRVRCYRGGVYPLIQLLKERRAIPDFPQHQRRKGVAVEARPLKRKTRPRNLRSSQSSFSHRYFLGSSRLHGLLLYFCKLRGSLPRTLVSSQFASSNWRPVFDTNWLFLSHPGSISLNVIVSVSEWMSGFQKAIRLINLTPSIFNSYLSCPSMIKGRDKTSNILIDEVTGRPCDFSTNFGWGWHIQRFLNFKEHQQFASPVSVFDVENEQGSRI